MENKNNQSRGVWLIVIIVAVLLLTLIGGSGSSSSSSSNKYSDDYYNNKSYRDNVNSIAGAYGKDSDEVDRVIQAIAGEMN